MTEHRDAPAPSSCRVPQIGITIRHASSGSAASASRLATDTLGDRRVDDFVIIDTPIPPN